MTTGEPTHAPTHGGHEPRDVSPRSIVIAGSLLLAVVLLTFAGMAGLVVRYQAREARESAPASPLAKSYGRQAPPEPRLQSDPLEDLRRLRAREDALLDGYGWDDRGAGTVRIPIERAVDLLVERASAGSGKR